MGANVQWGIFSKSIPGRVGYQCSDFWQLLIKENKVIDPNYILNGDNKLKYKRRRMDDSVIDNQFRKFAFTIKDDISGTLPSGWMHPNRPDNVDDIAAETTKKWVIDQ